MARALRLSFKDAIYHVTSRGIRRDRIFRSRKDKEKFLDKMVETFTKYAFICLGYCLMDNHYHLLIKTPLGNISQGIHFLNCSYGNWFKAKYKSAGPIFQGRFKALLVPEDQYLLQVSAYLHLNPVRAGLAEKPEDFQYSSFRDYLTENVPCIKSLEPSLILGMFDQDRGEAARKYYSFVMENLERESPLTQPYLGVAIGGEEFLALIRKKISGSTPEREITGMKKLNCPSAECILAAVQRISGQTLEQIKQKGNVFRSLSLYLLKKHSLLKLREIGNLFGMDYVAVSQATKRFGTQLQKSRELVVMIKKALKILDIEG